MPPLPPAADPYAAFQELLSLLAAQEPLGLLTQLTMTFQFHPQGEFKGEASNTARWQRYIEFVAGYLLVRPYPATPGSATDGATVEQIEKLVTAYFHSVDMHDLLRDEETKTNCADVLLKLVRTYAIHVRGNLYPHQFYDYARALYAPHDEWFKGTLGFTIDDALQIATALPVEYSRRTRESKLAARKRAAQVADDLIGTGQAAEGDRTNIEVAVGCQLHFGNSVNVLGFTVKELASFAGVSEEIAVRFLGRMSQTFGHHNPDFPKTFTDALAAPTDYNTLNERPLVAHGGRYWVLVPPVFRSALMATFYFDLIRDKKYRPTFDKERAAFLEAQTAEYLRRVFPKDSVFLNPLYPNNEEFADVLVLYDRKILVVQCKSKVLTHVANIGGNLDKLRDDLSKGVKDAFEQGVRAREYLLISEDPDILLGSRRVAIDMRQVNAVYVINVTLTPFQDLTTRFSNHPELGLFKGDDYPWSVSLGSLDVLTMFLASPARFLHYLARRLDIEKTPFIVSGDEMDLLGYYIAQGMYFSAKELKGLNALSITGLSSDIDRYMFERFEAGMSPVIPQPPMPPGFARFIEAIEESGAEYAVDCAIILLNLSYVARARFIGTVEEAKASAQGKGLVQSAWGNFDDGNTGISFLAIPGPMNRTDLFEGMMSVAIEKKRATACEQWAAFAWVVGSGKEFDTLGYLSYDLSDSELDERIRRARSATIDEP
jgi:hypothetical protein